MSRKGVVKPIPGLPPDLIEALRLALLGPGFIHTGHVVPGSITPGLVDIDMHFFEGTFTNNSPSAGYVAWAGVKITFRGETHVVTSGNTDKMYIWWELASPGVLSSSDDYPIALTPYDVVVALNESGIHRMVMIRGGIVNEHMIGIPYLSAIIADLGLILAGELRLGTGTPGVDFTGIRIYKDGTTYRVGGYNNNVLQAYFDSDGKLKAGGGNVTLDADAIKIVADDDAWIKWITDSGLPGHIVARIRARYWITPVSHRLDIEAVGRNEAGNIATLQLTARNYAGTLVSSLSLPSTGDMAFYQTGLGTFTIVGLSTGAYLAAAQQAWQSVTYENSWVAFAADWEPAGYFKDSFGVVHLRGMVKDGTIGTTIFTLPSGYRPPLNHTFAVQSNNALGRCSVYANGTVVADVGSNIWFSLSGITFRAA